MKTRLAAAGDAGAIAEIYNQGIEDRSATFETRLRSPPEIEAWFTAKYPVVVVEQAGTIIAFASSSNYRPRTCYDGIAEFSVYVARAFRGQGAGRAALTGLIQACEDKGFWKLVSRVFPENKASLKLLESAGFREVGIYRNHGQLDGVWKDVVIVERLIESNLRPGV